MKKQILFAALLMSTGSSTYCLNNPIIESQDNTQLFWEGLKAGAATTLLVDALRAVAPSSSDTWLRQNYGLYKDELAAQIKALGALVFAAGQYPDRSNWHWRVIAMRALGALVGICATTYVEKVIADS